MFVYHHAHEDEHEFAIDSTHPFASFGLSATFFLALPRILWYRFSWWS